VPNFEFRGHTRRVGKMASEHSDLGTSQEPLLDPGADHHDRSAADGHEPGSTGLGHLYAMSGQVGSDEGQEPPQAGSVGSRRVSGFGHEPVMPSTAFKSSGSTGFHGLVFWIP
jgi:hypothetical protein